MRVAIVVDLSLRKGKPVLVDSYQEKLERVFQVNLEVAEVKDLEVMLERILTEARDLVHADAGSIYIREDDFLEFSFAQNETLRRRLGKNKKLPFSTFKIPINSHSVAGYVANTGKLLNLEDVYHLPDNVPFSFDKKFDMLSDYRTKSVLTVPLKDKDQKVIGVLQIINPKNDNNEIIPFNTAEVPIFQHFANSTAVAIERAQLTRLTFMRMIRMTELRDPNETGPHVNRVASYAQEIYEAWARKKGISQEEINEQKDLLKIAAILHDVGKIAISDSILKKPGKLTDDEYNVMKHHTTLGAKLFADGNTEVDQAVTTVALNHHERWDGNGYPGHVDPRTGTPLPGRDRGDGWAHGKKGEEIPVFGRAVAVADVYDALLSARAYKQAWTEDDVLEEMNRCSGSQFDPDMVTALMETVDTLRAIGKRFPYASNGTHATNGTV